ncbi:MAG: hypothetical protein WCG83_01895 [Candidatus Peregrinibacteria bacterium]
MSDTVTKGLADILAEGALRNGQMAVKAQTSLDSILRLITLGRPLIESAIADENLPEVQRTIKTLLEDVSRSARVGLGIQDETKSSAVAEERQEE